MFSTPPLYFKMYKPFGILCQLGSKNPREIKRKRFLGECFPFPEGIMPVGRLDERSEGLLLLSTDGKLSDHINRSGLEKEYLAQLDGDITEIALGALSAGVEIGFEGTRYRTRPCRVEKMRSVPLLPPPHPAIRIERHRPSTWIRIALTEGKFRQVRKMTAAVGFPTLRLIRVRVGSIRLDNMEPGSVVRLPGLL